jgi:hypothetical protein
MVMPVVIVITVLANIGQQDIAYGFWYVLRVRKRKEYPAGGMWRVMLVAIESSAKRPFLTLFHPVPTLGYLVLWPTSQQCCPDGLNPSKTLLHHLEMPNIILY